MNENELFQAALGLLPPWLVTQCRFSVEPGRLDLYLDFPRGSTFPCPLCGDDRQAARAVGGRDTKGGHLNCSILELRRIP